MITVTLESPSSVRLDTGKQSVVVFPVKQEKSSALLTLFAVPEEVPSEGTISWPGEYDIDGIAIRGIGHDEGGHVSYVLEVDGVRYAFLYSPLHDWNDHELELLGDVDVLVLPCDDLKLAQKLVDEIDPRMLIPVKGLGEDHLDDVLNAVGAKGKEVEKEHKIKGLPSEGREVVVLKP